MKFALFFVFIFCATACDDRGGLTNDTLKISNANVCKGNLVRDVRMNVCWFTYAVSAVSDSTVAVTIPCEIVERCEKGL
jgi:hypothetical protein